MTASMDTRSTCPAWPAWVSKSSLSHDQTDFSERGWNKLRFIFQFILTLNSLFIFIFCKSHIIIRLYYSVCYKFDIAFIQHINGTSV